MLRCMMEKGKNEPKTKIVHQSHLQKFSFKQRFFEFEIISTWRKVIRTHNFMHKTEFLTSSTLPRKVLLRQSTMSTSSISHVTLAYAHATTCEASMRWGMMWVISTCVGLFPRPPDDLHAFTAFFIISHLHPTPQFPLQFKTHVSTAGDLSSAFITGWF